MNAPKISFKIVYNQTDITIDLLPYVKRLAYTDKSQGEADEIELVLEDSQRLWQNEWYPVKGDSLTATIYGIDGILECGTFTVDEVSGEGSKDSGDVFTIKGIAAGIDKKLRTKTSYAHENKTLREIVNTVAGRHGLTVEGDIKNIRINRVTQYRETDLKFLKRISFEYGYTFSVREKKLVFTDVFNLEKKDPAFVVHRTELTGWQISDKTSKTYQRAKISYHDPRKKKIVSYEQKESEAAYEGAKVDKLELRVKAENEQQAELKSRVALYRANSLQQEGRLSLPGNVLALAGNNCELQGVGAFSGIYYVISSTHTIDPDNAYTTDCEIKLVGLVNKQKQKAATKTA